MSAERLVVVGDAMLDRDVDGRIERMAPDAPVPVVDELGCRVRPGGAGLAAALAAADGRAVTLVTAIGGDQAGRELRRALAAAAVDVIDLALAGPTPEKLRIAADGRSLLRLDRGGSTGVVGALTAAGRAAIGWAGAILVSDYGRGVTRRSDVRTVLSRAIADGVPVVWDPHPRGPAPVPGVRVATPNLAEARGSKEGDGGEPSELAARLVSRWEALMVCVTCGERGAVAARRRGGGFAVAADAVAKCDPCGAGDRFAAGLAGAYADGAGDRDAVVAAVTAATRFVAAGGARRVAFAPRPRQTAVGESATEADRVIAAVRARGGTVVATGGCFDLLHRGHVRTLEAARALGDCLVVCLNADESVRRLKGPGRPVVGARDRAAVLRALSCVDAVATFREDTPETILERLRPDVWAKGGDYAPDELPERAVLRRWGASTVVLPFLEGHSTTRLLEEASAHAI